MLHILWILLIISNFIVQIVYFRKPSLSLFLAKRITTPAMLVLGSLVIILTTETFSSIPVLLLLTMGLGEIGIEGSFIVEDKKDDTSAQIPWTVTAAGVLFLLVNLSLGIILFFGSDQGSAKVIGLVSGLCGIFCIVLLLEYVHHPENNILFQLRIYAIGLAVLAAGSIASIISGAGHLSIAGLVLSISDSLVLWRMGAKWKKKMPTDRKYLLVFLITILILYYGYIAVLIDSASPFFSV